MAPKRVTFAVAGSKKGTKKASQSMKTSSSKDVPKTTKSFGKKATHKSSGTSVSNEVGEGTVMKRPSALKNALGGKAIETHETLSEAGSINEKLDILKNADISPNEKLKLMHLNLSHPEWVKLHGRFSTAAEKDKELKTSHELALSRSEKRNLIAAFFLDPTKGPVFQHLSRQITTSQTLTKVEKWESTKEVRQKWTDDELEAMLASGRYICREDPYSPGVWEYRDTQKIEAQKKLDRTKVFSRKHDGDLQPENKDQDDESMTKNVVCSRQ